LDTKERFPKADPAATYAEFKSRDAQGDPLRRPREDWEGARARAGSTPAWKTWLAERRADIDDWMAHRRDRVEWVAGWWHDFVSPKDGSYLTWTPDEPGPETLRSPSDPKVALTPKLHGAWVYRFRATHGNKMAEAARLYRLTGERRYADWAAAQIDFYADNFEKWPLQQRGSGIWISTARLFHQPLDEAVNLVKHIEVARLTADAVSPERRRGWLDRLFRPQTEILDASFQSVHNIACWQRSATGLVALLYNDDALWQKALHAPFGIKKQLAEGVTSDYFWYEQSLSYNDYVVQALLPLFLLAGLTGRGEELRQEMLVAQNLMLAPLALRFPNGQLPTPADGPRRTAPSRGLFADAWRVFPTPIGRAERERTPGWSSLVDPVSAADADRPGAATIPPPRSRSLESSRMALLCKDGWQVYFHYGQLLQSHSQAEALNYEVWHGNTDLTHDTGTVGYGSPLHREFYTKGVAHNVPLVNGEGQSGWAPGELLEWDAAKGRVSARQPQYRPGVRATRTLDVEIDQLVDVTTLELTDAATPDAPLGLTLHVQGKVALPESFTLAPDFAAGRPAGFGYGRDVRGSTATSERQSLLVHYAEHAYRLTLFADVPCRLFHAATPDAPPRQRESLYLETAAPCRKVTFTTVWEVARP
jgi:Heparinase II/III-like protein.